MEVNGIPIDVVRKDIKNLHISVRPPAGRVRVSAPMRFDDEAIRLAIVSRLGWIRRKQNHFSRQERQSEREMVTGESHYFRGRRYRLNVVEVNKAAGVRIANNQTLELQVRPGATQAKRRGVLDQWYRQHLRQEIPKLIEHWEPIVGVKVAEWRIKRMKTRWGTCNMQVQRIWLNLELAKKPAACLEYVLVHEMVHLLERYHNDQFRQYMDQFMPKWRLYRDQLNQFPLAHEGWDY